MQCPYVSIPAIYRTFPDCLHLFDCAVGRQCPHFSAQRYGPTCPCRNRAAEGWGEYTRALIPVKSQLLPGFRLQVGKRRDRTLLLHCLWHSYQAVNPNVASDHLANLLDQYWTEATPVWFAYATDPEVPCGCLWLGRAVDALTGEGYTHVFLVYVAPDYRRRGLGSALMAHAEQWAARHHDHQIGLQVFAGHQPAQELYQSLGYQAQSLSLVKTL